MSYFCDKYPIIEKKTLAAGVFSLTVKCPEAANAAEVGQFANILADGYTLRRPISICEIDKEQGTLRFVFEVRGKGTEVISRANVGDNLDVLGPLGNGFFDTERTLDNGFDLLKCFASFENFKELSIRRQSHFDGFG